MADVWQSRTLFGMCNMLQAPVFNCPSYATDGMPGPKVQDLLWTLSVKSLLLNPNFDCLFTF